MTKKSEANAHDLNLNSRSSVVFLKIRIDLEFFKIQVLILKKISVWNKFYCQGIK